MLNTARKITLVNTAQELQTIRCNPEALRDLKIQNESLCVYALANKGLFSTHPWQHIQEKSRTPAIQMLTACSAPHYILDDIMKYHKPLPEVTVSAMIIRKPSIYYEIPDIYKTFGIRQLFTDICRNEFKRYHWGFGTISL
jgi:hypothetical protein